MATTLTYAYAADICKSERDERGDLIVYGKATGPDLDLDEQVCDPDWLRSAMPEWAEWSNLREMHQPICAGVGLATEAQGEDWWLKSKVIDANTAKKIEAGGLRGYSVGIKNPKVVKDAHAAGGRIVGGQIVEISYVDRPCNPTATMMISKAVGGDTNPTLGPVDAAPAGGFTPADMANLVADKAAAAVRHALRRESADENGKPAEGQGGGEQPESADENAPGGREATGKADGPTVEFLTAHYGLSAQQVEDTPRYLVPLLTDLAKRDVSTQERRQLAGRGSALPDGSFPIASVSDLRNAIQAIGRAKNPAAAKAHIKRRAAALGRSDLVPEGWKTVAKAGEGEQIHDPAEIGAVRDGLINLIKAELDELSDGNPELCDVQELLCGLKYLMCWWANEAASGETDSPYDSDGSASMTLAAEPEKTNQTTTSDPDVTTTGPTEGSTDEDRLTELVKNAVTDATRALTDASDERIKALEAAVAKATERADAALALPEPGGPVITRTATAAAAKAADVATLTAQADQLLQRAEAVEGHDPMLARGYRLRAQELRTKAAA